MDTLEYAKAERISLKKHPRFDEKWLQSRIADDPTIIGLGEIVVLDRERRQEHGGRLDLLLTDPDETLRYEVELMLGRTDESHIVRIIEYWDIERRRYPGYEHCAVLIAEDITSRFLNVIGLLAGTIPLVAIKLNALEVEGNIVLNFVTVIDQRSLRRDDTSVVVDQPTDRSAWLKKSSEPVMGVVDSILAIINEKAKRKQQPNYNKHYIGLTDGTKTKNFMRFRPWRNFLTVFIPGEWTHEELDDFEDAGLLADETNGNLRLRLSPADFAKHKELISTKIHAVVGQLET